MKGVKYVECLLEFSFTMSNMTPPAVAVVGAGLAGLSTAIFLAKAGVRVDLYEQNHTLEAQGVETTWAY